MKYPEHELDYLAEELYRAYRAERLRQQIGQELPVWRLVRPELRDVWRHVALVAYFETTARTERARICKQLTRPNQKKRR